MTEQTAEDRSAVESGDTTEAREQQEARDKIVVRNLFKIFGQRPEEAMELVRQGLGKDEIFEKTGMTVGVHDANFTIREGEIFVVMGLSGSGKSTMVRMFNRLIDPTVGEILVDGKDVTRMTKQELIEFRRRDISMVFQSFALMPHQTVLENAAFGLEVAGIGTEQRRKAAADALQSVGLGPWINTYPAELSGGMKQRVGLARALATNPTIMLMDEAFSALDPLIRAEMQDELIRLQHENQRTVVFISHDLDEAMRIGDRIAIMEQGRVVQVGTPEEILKSPANDYVRSFFRGVDVSQVFTAGDIARREQVTVIERPGVSTRAALERLREHDREVGIVMDRGGAYQGMVSAESLIKEIQSPGEPKYANAMLKEVKPVESTMPITEVLSLVAESRWPVPVVDERGYYLGSISKTALLQTLDRAS